MSQVQLVIALLSLLILGLGAIALVALLGAKRENDGFSELTDFKTYGSETDRVALAQRRRHFMQRYPDWAGRDFQNDRTSPWYNDPEFSDLVESGRRR